MFDRQVEHFLTCDASLDEEPVEAFVGQGHEYRFQRLAWQGYDGFHLHADAAGGLAYLRDVRFCERIALVGRAL